MTASIFYPFQQSLDDLDSPSWPGSRKAYESGKFFQPQAGDTFWCMGEQILVCVRESGEVFNWNYLGKDRECEWSKASPDWQKECLDDILELWLTKEE